MSDLGGLSGPVPRKWESMDQATGHHAQLMREAGVPVAPGLARTRVALELTMIREKETETGQAKIESYEDMYWMRSYFGETTVKERQSKKKLVDSASQVLIASASRRYEDLLNTDYLCRLDKY